MENADVIAWWGAGLSTLLGMVKLWEAWRNRFRIDVGYNFTSDPDIGNEIHIRNLAGYPVILCYWQLDEGIGVWPFRRFSVIEELGQYASDSTIGPHSSMTLKFSGAYYFDWINRTAKHRKIYIRLFIAGRRPVLKKIHG